jgi:hypothetical protein
VEGVDGGSGGKSAVQQIARGGEIQELGLSLLLFVYLERQYVCLRSEESLAYQCVKIHSLAPVYKWDAEESPR